MNESVDPIDKDKLFESCSWKLLPLIRIIVDAFTPTGVSFQTPSVQDNGVKWINFLEINRIAQASLSLQVWQDGLTRVPRCLKTRHEHALAVVSKKSALPRVWVTAGERVKGIYGKVKLPWSTLSFDLLEMRGVESRRGIKAGTTLMGNKRQQGSLKSSSSSFRHSSCSLAGFTSRVTQWYIHILRRILLSILYLQYDVYLRTYVQVVGHTSSMSSM